MNQVVMFEFQVKVRAAARIVGLSRHFSDITTTLQSRQSYD